MIKSTQYWVRKSHRYLGLIIGLQFIMWTAGGLYFSWTDIDDIHGDQFKKEISTKHLSSGSLSNISDSMMIHELELKFIGEQSYFWINNEKLVNTVTGEIKDSISEDEALNIAKNHMNDQLKVKSIEKIEMVNSHHEYRERPLPAWVISYKGANHIKAYVSAKDGNFQRVRHSAWRNFDFLWMLHTMDYRGRDDFNNWILRTFSVLGLLTVLLGFVLFFYSSPSIKKWVSRSKIK